MTEDFLPIRGTDHIEFYVGNARQAAMFYQHCMGFELIAYAGPETGLRDRASYVLQQNKIRFVLTTGLRTDSEISAHVHRHGDGVKVLALWVDDARQSFHETTSRGAVPVSGPQVLRDDFGEVALASIKTYGDTIHTFVERKTDKGPVLPGYKPLRNSISVTPVGLQYVDHCVGNVELGKMNEWVKFYEEVMGFKLLITFDDKDISTEYSALMSKVMQNGKYDIAVRAAQLCKKLARTILRRLAGLRAGSSPELAVSEARALQVRQLELQVHGLVDSLFSGEYLSVFLVAALAEGVVGSAMVGMACSRVGRRPWFASGTPLSASTTSSAE